MSASMRAASRRARRISRAGKPARARGPVRQAVGLLTVAAASVGVVTAAAVVSANPAGSRTGTSAAAAARATTAPTAATALTATAQAGGTGCVPASRSQNTDIPDRLGAATSVRYAIKILSAGTERIVATRRARPRPISRGKPHLCANTGVEMRTRPGKLSGLGVES